jgi:hypothetical protein
LRRHTRAAGRGPASEDERTPHPAILGVGQFGQPVELRHAAGPQVVRALDDLGHVGRHFLGVLGGQD